MKKIVKEFCEKHGITEDQFFGREKVGGDLYLGSVTITGACDFGCRVFMDKHKIPYKVDGERAIEAEPIIAKDLLKLLKKSNAYGAEKFERLMSA
jgi:hypothetical protein